MLVESESSDCESIDPSFPESSLLQELARVLSHIHVFKEKARDFYYAALFSRHRCPECSGQLWPTGPNEARCDCGLHLDPTVMFQRSSCCGARVVRRRCHYACTRCSQAVHSMFLFDERVFDHSYFRTMMAESRERKRRKKEAIRQLLAETRSDALDLACDPSQDVIDELSVALNDFVGGFAPVDDYPCEEGTVFHMEEYSAAMRESIQAGDIWFSAFQPLCGDLRKDRAWRFITLTYMEHDREVDLEQHGEDILVRWHEAYTEG